MEKALNVLSKVGGHVQQLSSSPHKDAVFGIVAVAKHKEDNSFITSDWSGTLALWTLNDEDADFVLKKQRQLSDGSMVLAGIRYKSHDYAAAVGSLYLGDAQRLGALVNGRFDGSGQ